MPDPAVFGLKEVLELYVKDREAILQMWSFFSAGTLAVLGFTVGSDKATLSKAAVRTVQFGYLVFAFGNLVAVVSSQSDYCAVARLVARLAEAQKLTELGTMYPIPPGLFAIFHIVVTIAVLAAIQITYNSHAKADA